MENNLKEKTLQELHLMRVESEAQKERIGKKLHDDLDYTSIVPFDEAKQSYHKSIAENRSVHNLIIKEIDLRIK